MAEEMLSYSTCNMQDWPMPCRFEVHTSRIGQHSVETLHAIQSDMNIVTFAEWAR
jgi:hypothetical protein